jgi:hypothetical protein
VGWHRETHAGWAANSPRPSHMLAAPTLRSPPRWSDERRNEACAFDGRRRKCDARCQLPRRRSVFLALRFSPVRFFGPRKYPSGGEDSDNRSILVASPASLLACLVVKRWLAQLFGQKLFLKYACSGFIGAYYRN